MRISDWSSDVCSSDLNGDVPHGKQGAGSLARSDASARRMAVLSPSCLRFYPAALLDSADVPYRQLPRLWPVRSAGGLWLVALLLRCRARSEERRVGKACGDTGRIRGSPFH